MPAPIAAPTTSAPEVVGAPSLPGAPPSASTLSSPQPAPPISPVPADQVTWPIGFKPLTAASNPAAADPNQQQQQQGAGSSSKADSEDEEGRAKNSATLKKTRRAITLDSILPVGSPFASAAPQPAPSKAKEPPSNREVMLTIIRDGHTPSSTAGPPTCTLQEVMGNYARYAQVPAAALQVAHQGCPLEPHRWPLTLLQLGLGPSEVQLHVIQPMPEPPSTPDHDPLLSLLQAAEEVSTPACDSPVSATSQAPVQSTSPAAATAATVHVTIHMEGRATMAGDGPADHKLGDLLAHATGLPLDALQVLRNGCPVDRAQWACSFAELAWGSPVELSIRAEVPATLVQPGCPPAGPTLAVVPLATPTSAPASSNGAALPTAYLPHQGRHALLHFERMVLH